MKKIEKLTYAELTKDLWGKNLQEAMEVMIERMMNKAK